MLSFQKITKVTLVLFLILTIFIFRNFVSAWWFLILILIYFVLIIIGSFHIRWNFFLNAKHHNYKTSPDEIALTFDDGPHPEFTPKVLDLLKKYNFKATFFCIGENIEKYPEIVGRINREGHLLGNHSFSHTNNYGFLSEKQVIKDLEKTQVLLKNITKEDNIFFRPPFGVTNPNIAKAVKTLHLHTFGWDIRSLDTIAKSPEKVINKIKKKLKKGSIILLHDTSMLSYTVLEQLLLFFDNKNIKGVTLNDLFNSK